MNSFLLTLILTTIAVIGVTAAILFYVNKKLKETRLKKYAFLLPILAIAFWAFEVYLQFNPLDSYYLHEFRKNTSIDLPDKAEVISEKSEFAVFNGLSFSTALIEVSKKDYISVLRELERNPTFKLDTALSSGNIMSYEMNKPDIDKCFLNWPEQEFKVFFLKNKHSIVYENVY